MNQEVGFVGVSHSRRSFIKWSALAAGSLALSSGLVACSDKDEIPGNETAQAGDWKTAPCYANCSCSSSRCLLRVNVVDGVPKRIVTDTITEDSPENPQKRACGRGRAQISNILSADRLKYPLKRKSWSPENPNGEMRGKDEWERISWDEALDIFASEMKKNIDQYGTRGILMASQRDIGDTYFDVVDCLVNELGGALHLDWATISVGSWPWVEMMMTGGLLEAPDMLSLQESDLHLFFGCNWQANKGGNTAWQLYNAIQKGGKVIIIDPWLNQTAQALADEWVPIRPGTDGAMILGMAYHQITNNLHDQSYLDTYCVGFDVDHMPKDAPLEENFKDYILGACDNEPKTPEWATAICGVPADVIRRLAEEVAAAERVDFFAGQSTTKIPAGEAFGQIFYTFAFMHGGIGTPGNYVSWVGLHEGMSTTPYANAGDSSNGKGLNPANPLTPPMLGFTTNIVEAEEDWDAWDWIEYSEAWQSCLDGAYGRDSWPRGKKPLDIHMIYVGGYSNPLNQLPNTNAAIELFRKVDFVVGGDPFFNASMRYCDVVLPVASWWEKGELAWHNNDDTVFWADRIIEPLYESRSEYQIVQGLTERMGVDLAKVDTMTAAERTYYSLAGAFYAVDDMGTTKPLLTITQDDLDELGIVPFDGGTTTVMNNGAPLEVRGLSGEPQEGLLTVGEFKERGFYQIERAYGDALTHVPYADFFADPVKNARPTGSGKFEIHSAALAAAIAANGFSQIAPIGKWQFNPEQGQGAQTEEYPLLLWTPHSLRRAHSTNDSVATLREAFPQECFMSTVDAEARGIKNGDIVLMSSPHGKVLRPAKVMPTVIPGAVALQDGAWTNIDEATGIDIGGNPNILQAPAASGQGVQAWTGTICQVEKYTGDIKLEPDKKRALVLPRGIE